MKIQSIPLGGEECVDVRSETTQIVMVKISGSMDQEDPVLRRARKLVERTGSREAIDSFNFAISTNALSTDT